MKHQIRGPVHEGVELPDAAAVDVEVPLHRAREDHHRGARLPAAPRLYLKSIAGNPPTTARRV